MSHQSSSHEEIPLSIEQMRARIAELEPLERFMQAWGEKHPHEFKDNSDFIRDIKRDIATCLKDREQFSTPATDCDHCYTFGRLLQLLDSSEQTIAELRERQVVIAQKWLNVSVECDELRPIKAEREELRSQLQRERAVLDELAAAVTRKLADCLECKDAALMPGEYCSDECVAVSDALAQHAALRSGTATTLSEPTGTDDDLIPRATVDAMRKHLEEKS